MLKFANNEQISNAQGDVLLKPLAEMPGDLELIPTKEHNNTLQLSEVSGHRHWFKPDAGVELYTIKKPSIELKTEGNVTTITRNDFKVLKVTDPNGATLYHGKGFDENPRLLGKGDHDAQHVAPGLYYVDIVREYDYESMQPRRVVD